jgi:hypothetical protein
MVIKLLMYLSKRGVEVAEVDPPVASTLLKRVKIKIADNYNLCIAWLKD